MLSTAMSITSGRSPSGSSAASIAALCLIIVATTPNPAPPWLLS